MIAGTQIFLSKNDTISFSGFPSEILRVIAKNPIVKRGKMRYYEQKIMSFARERRISAVSLKNKKEAINHAAI